MRCLSVGNLSGHAYTFVQPCLHFRPNMDGFFSERGRTEGERTKKRSTLSKAGKFPADRSQTLRAAWPLKRTNMSAIGACLFFLRSVFPCVISIKKRKGKFLFSDTSSCAALGSSYVFLSYEEQFAILGQGPHFVFYDELQLVNVAADTF